VGDLRSDLAPRVMPFFIGPDGRSITLADLPSPNLKRFLPRHKAMVVAAVQNGLITLDEACKRYELSIEDYLSWYRAFGMARSPAAGPTENGPG
jgi:Protein of unknown function (DUF1153)